MSVLVLAETSPALPANAPTWLVVLVAALPAFGALGAAMFPMLARGWARRKKRKQDAERALIRQEEKALTEEVHAVEQAVNQPAAPPPGRVTDQVDASMHLVEELVRALQARVERLEAARDELQHRLDEVERDLSKRDIEITQLRAENAELRRENDRLRDQIQTMTMLKGRGS